MPLVADLAKRLIEAEQQRRPLTEPFTDSGDLDVESAYAVQQGVVDARLQRGAVLVGAKLGLTSKAKQHQMHVDEPLYGWLTSDMLLPAGERLDLNRFIHPRAEPEIGFLLRETVSTPATVASVLAATEKVFGALEIIDSRYDGFRFRLPDVIADNASSAAITLGSVVADPEQVGDLRLIGCVLRVDGTIVATAAGAAVLGHPAASVAWLINELGRRGRQLARRSLVLSGALTNAVPVNAGGSITAEFDGLGIAAIRS